MSKNFQKQLKEKIKELPGYLPKDDCWNAISDSLKWENKLTHTIAELPLYEPENLNWNQLKDKLQGQKNFKKRQLLLKISIAASFALLFGIGSIIWVANFKGLVFEKEIVTNTDLKIDLENTDSDDPIQAILFLCESGSLACKTADFEQKIALYNELNNEIKALSEKINQVGNSPEMVQSIIKMENLKSNTLQELIIMVHS